MTQVAQSTQASLVTIIEVVLVIFALAGIFAAGLVVRVSQQRATEWRDLAESRGAAVDDLKNEVAAMRAEVAELRGAVSALESLKSREIAETVIDLMGQSALWTELRPGGSI